MHLDMDLHKFEDNPQLDFEPNNHSIDFFEIMIFRNGNGHYETNNYKIPIQPYTIIFASPNQVKRCLIEEKSAIGFHLVFKSEFLEEFFQDQLFVYKLSFFFNYTSPPFVQMNVNEFKLLNYVLNEIVYEIQHYKTDSKTIIQSLIHFTLLKLNRVFNTQHHINFSDQSGILIQFKNLIEKNFKHNKSVLYYAEKLMLSKKKLNHIVKSNTGYSPIDHINQRKLQEIKTLVLFSNKTISEIAYHMGYSDPNNLTRFFKNMTGTTPSHFKLQVQDDSF